MSRKSSELSLGRVSASKTLMYKKCKALRLPGNLQRYTGRIKVGLNEKNFKVPDLPPIDSESVWRRIAYKEMMEREKIPIDDCEVEHVIEIRTVRHTERGLVNVEIERFARHDEMGDKDPCQADVAVQLDQNKLERDAKMAHDKKRQEAFIEDKYCFLKPGKNVNVTVDDEEAMYETNQKVQYAQVFKYFDGLICYILFLIAATVVFTMTDSKRGIAYRQNVVDMIDGYFQPTETETIRYHEMVYPSHIIPWVRDYLMPIIYHSDLKLRVSPHPEGGVSWPPSISAKPNDHLFSHHNALIGNPTIRQVRVKGNSCRVANVMSPVVNGCSKRFEEKSEYRKPIWNKKHSFNRYNLNVGTKVSGAFGNYPDSGYAYYFDIYSLTQANLTQMMTFDWIDINTRAVIVEFLLYNPHVDLFAYTTLLMELPPVGGVFATQSVDLIDLSLLPTKNHVNMRAMEFISLLVVIMTTISLIFRFLYQPKSFFYHWWNYMDTIIVFVCIMFFIFTLMWAQQFAALAKKIASLRFHPYDSHPSIGHYLDYSSYRLFWAMLLCCLMALKTFPLLTYFNMIAAVFDSLSLAMKELFCLALIGLCMFMALGSSGLILFNGQEREFSTWALTLRTIFLINLSSFDTDSLMIETPVIGTLYLTTYYIIVFCMFTGLLYAVFVYHFAEIFSIQNRNEGRIGIQTAIVEIFEILAYKIGLDSLIRFFRNLGNKLRKTELSYVIDALRRRGYRRKEVKIYLRMKGINPNGVFTTEQMIEHIKHIEEDDTNATVCEQYTLFDAAIENMELRVEYMGKALRDTTYTIAGLVQRSMKTSEVHRGTQVDEGASVRRRKDPGDDEPKFCSKRLRKSRKSR